MTAGRGNGHRPYRQGSHGDPGFVVERRRVVNFSTVQIRRQLYSDIRGGRRATRTVRNGVAGQSNLDVIFRAAR